MTSIVNFPWRAAHHATGMEKISVGRFALASAPLIGVAVSTALFYLKSGELDSGIEREDFLRAIQIVSERSDYIKTAIISGLFTLAMIALGASLGGLAGLVPLAPGCAMVAMFFYAEKRANNPDALIVKLRTSHALTQQRAQRQQQIDDLERQIANIEQQNADLAQQHAELLQRIAQRQPQIAQPQQDLVQCQLRVMQSQ